jgi:hypothetical protein
MLGSKASLRKFKEIEIAHCILSHCNEIKLKLESKRKHRKYLNT